MRMPKLGSLVRIRLQDGTNVFSRVLPNAQAAFYDYCVQDNQDISDFSEIYNSEVLFITAIMNYAYKSGRWKVVDYKDLEPIFLESRKYFIKDKISGEFRIYDSAEGSMSKSSYEECKNLECAAVWDPEQIEERILNHYKGIKYVWME